MLVRSILARLATAGALACALLLLRQPWPPAGSLLVDIQQCAAIDPSDCNVLVIMLEDCSTRAIGCYGNDLARTPNIDRLADSALRFDRAYCQYPACNPSRASFLTGLRPTSTRVLSNEALLAERLPAGVLTLPERVAKRGVHQVTVGKLFHRSPPQLAAVDRVELWPPFDGAVARRTPRETRPATPVAPAPPLPPPPEIALPAAAEVPGQAPPPSQDRPQREQFDRYGRSARPEELQRDHRIGARAVEVLEDLASRNERFFMTVGTLLPHTPIECPQRFLDLFDPWAFELPVDWDRRWRSYNPDIFTDRWPTEREVRECIRAYFAGVAFVDQQVGKILAALERTGLAANTIVILTADHGFHLGEHGRWSKYSLLDQAVRVPLIVRLPGSAHRGTACAEIVELVDLTPTICDVFGAPMPLEESEGISFVPLLLDPTTPWKRAAFSMVAFEGGVQRLVRSQRYSLIEESRGRQVSHRLFDVALDPWQTRDLSTEPAYADVLRWHADVALAGWRSVLPPAR